MKPLNTSARAAASCSTRKNDSAQNHVFPWRWKLADLKDVPWNGLNVFTCFSCGGGSSMGYKRAGYHVIGNVEIDRDMNTIYKYNHKPKYNYNIDIRDFISIPDQELPEELFKLDVLDGSPPCSVFSTAGDREKGWNTEKQFREGQKMQRLDDLFFAFINVAEKLKPRVVVAENVKGLITGNAKGYVNEIVKAFRKAGYVTQIFLLNSAYMGVPQARERVFFIAQREDQHFPKLKLEFHEPVIPFGEVRTAEGELIKDGKYSELLRLRRPDDKYISSIYQRVYGKKSGFNNVIVHDDCVVPTLGSSNMLFRYYDGKKFSAGDFINIQSFPQDYNFLDQSPKYVCGMSVPPVMMAQIARQIYLQWLRCSG